MRIALFEKNSPPRQGFVAVIGVLLALFGFLLLNLLELLTDIEIGGFGVAVFKWILVAMIIFVVLIPERSPLASIGVVRLDRWDVLIGVGIFLFGMISVGVLTETLVALGIDTAPFGSGENGQSTRTISAILVSLFIGVTAEITEELLYRGYALERLEGLTGSTWIAGTVTAVVFILLHFGRHSIGDLLIITP